MARTRDQRPPRHKDKDVQKLIKAAIAAGWYVDHPGAHPWGWLVCGGQSHVAGECRITIFSTPKGSNQATVLRRKLAKCPHGHGPPA